MALITSSMRYVFVVLIPVGLGACSSSTVAKSVLPDLPPVVTGSTAKAKKLLSPSQIKAVIKGLRKSVEASKKAAQ